MAGRAFILDSKSGWRIAPAHGAIPELMITDYGIELKSLPQAERHPVDEDGTFGGLDFPTGLAVDAAGRVYVSDVTRHALRRYDPHCPPKWAVEVLPCVGGDGSQARNLGEPRGLAIWGDDLVVADAGNARVLVIMLRRLALRAVIGPIDDTGKGVPVGDARAWRPWDVAVDGHGRIYVTDRRGRVFGFNRRGRLLFNTGLSGMGQGPIHICVACPPPLATTMRPISGEMYLKEPPQGTMAYLERDAERFVRTGDQVEFRRPGGGELRTVTVGTQVSRVAPHGIENVLTWSNRLMYDYSVAGSVARLATAIRQGEQRPIVRVESSAGWRPGDWASIDDGVTEFVRVTEVGSEKLRLQRSDSSAWREGALLARVTPILAVGDARPGIGKLWILNSEGDVIGSGESLHDLLAFARYGGLPYGSELLPVEESNGVCLPRRCACHPVAPTPEALTAHLTAALATIGKTFTRVPPPAYTPTGRAVIGPLDSRIPRCQWHSILAEVTLPQDTRLVLDTLTSETELTSVDVMARDAEWRLADLDGEFPNNDRSPDRYLWNARQRDTLVQSGPGRYLYLRLTMAGNNAASPLLRALHVTFPRRSYLEYLPAVYQEDLESRSFLDRFLSIFQTTLEGFDREVDQFARFLDPKGAPEEFIPWLASWLALSVEWPWPSDKRDGMRRALLAQVPKLYRKHGTPAGLRQAITAYTGLPEGAVHIIESFCARNWVRLGQEKGRGNVLFGTCLFDRMQLDVHAPLGQSRIDGTGDPLLDSFSALAHKFTVVVPATYTRDPAASAALRQLVELERPAHTEAKILSIRPRLRVGIQSIIGMDTVVGCYPITEICSGLLGVDTVLTCPGPPGVEIGRSSRIGESMVVA